MKKKIFALLMVLGVSGPAKADMWGGDLIILGKLLANAVHQLYQLKQMVDSSRDTLSIMEDVNRGLHGALDLADQSGLDPRVLRSKEYSSVRDALRKVEVDYGASSASVSKVMQTTDLEVAKTLYVAGRMNSYAEHVSEIGNSIKRRGSAASPGGAQKVTAQGVGQILNTMAESLKLQSKQAEMDANTKAADNSADKERAKIVKRDTDALRSAMVTQQVKFKAPMF